MQRTLERSLALFGVDDQGLHLSGHLFEMDRYLTWCPNPPARGAGASRYLGSIADDIWNIATLVERLEWMRNEARTNGHLADRWSRYAATDIQGIHVDLRSILDYVAELAGHVFLPVGQAPTSFRKLLEWVDKNPSRVLPELRLRIPVHLSARSAWT